MTDLRKKPAQRLSEKLRSIAEAELDVAIQKTREAADNGLGIEPDLLLKLAGPGRDKTLRKKVVAAMVRAKEAALVDDLFPVTQEDGDDSVRTNRTASAPAPAN